MGQASPQDEGCNAFFTRPCHKSAPERAKSRRNHLPERRRIIGSPAMFAILMTKLRRWIGYRPERRYMRGTR